MIISILNQKGGSGKTTLAVNLARYFTLRKEKTLLIDSDPQGSARDWHTNSDGELLEVIGLDRPTIDKDINKFKMLYKWIIVDGAPQLSNMAVKTVMCSDVVLIPVQPSPYDIWASNDIVELVKARMDITDGKLKAAFVVSRQISNTCIGKEVRTILEQYHLPIFQTGTFQRVAYAATANGSTVFDGDLLDNSPSAIEIIKIADELEKFINE